MSLAIQDRDSRRRLPKPRPFPVDRQSASLRARVVFLRAFFRMNPSAFDELCDVAADITQGSRNDQWREISGWLYGERLLPPTQPNDSDESLDESTDVKWELGRFQEGKVRRPSLWWAHWIRDSASRLAARPLTFDQLLNEQFPPRRFHAGKAPTTVRARYLAHRTNAAWRRNARLLVLYLQGANSKAVAVQVGRKHSTVATNIKRFASFIRLPLPFRQGRPKLT